MLKIKGLKKKKKGKKSKHKEEELFEAAELEEYRKEQQRKQEELKEKGLETHEDDEEWQKFKLLTSGVDDILKKTQGDLDRIKSTSFFQKKSPVPSEAPKETTSKPSEKPERPREPTEKRWVGFEEGDSSLTVEVTEAEETSVAETSEQEAKPDFFTEEEEESEEEDDLDDLFDTSYVDAVESGEVVLAYIPESPTQEDDGYDPFDTSIVDKVISVKDQKKALVTLGSAVEVLSGIADKPVTTGQEDSPLKTSKRRRPRPQDLLLGSFDEAQPSTTPIQIAVEPAPKSILDDDPVFEEQTSETLGFVPVTPVTDVSVPVVRQEPQKQSSGFDLRNLVDEFVSPVTPTVDLQSLQLNKPVTVVDDFDDEFAALAAESLSKEKDVSKTKPPPRPLPPAANQKQIQDNDLEDDGDLEDDPFDTTFADKVLPGKYELKIIEKEVLHDHVLEDTTNIVQNKINEVLKTSDLTINLPKKKFQETFEDDEFKLLSPSQRDLLGGSTTDLSSIGPNPIQPQTAPTVDANNLHYSDPFDTSVIDSLVAPKKTELKYLEKELLVDQNKSTEEVVEDDEDFDPRAGESKPPSRPDSLVVATAKRVSVPKIVAFDVKNGTGTDLLAVDQEESSKIGKPLTPYYTDKNIIEEKLTSESEIDPFDTSYVNNAPGKVELKLLENELVGNNAPKEDITDPDFDPRADDATSAPVVEIEKQAELRPDIISEDVSSDIKLHTPVTPRKIEEDLKKEEIDPFDTSTVSNLAPGKAEIKILEKELIESGNVPLQASDKSSEVVKNLLEKAKKQSTSSDTDLLTQTHDDDTSKPLTPIPADFSLEEDDYDPFDTSAVENILPGKTEIKLLESELLN